MAYTADLVLILQVLFQISLSEDRFQGKATPDCVTEVIYQFVWSKKKRMTHDSIIAFVQNQFEYWQMPASDDVENIIESLIKQNKVGSQFIANCRLYTYCIVLQIDEDDKRFDLARSPLSSLLEILKVEVWI
jgi:hypothetical protein